MSKHKKLSKRNLRFESVEGRDAPTPVFPVSADVSQETGSPVDTNPIETMSFGDDDTVGGGGGDDSVGGGSGGG